MLLQYLITVVLCVGILIVFVIVARYLLSLRIWYPTDPYWGLLHWIHKNMKMVCIISGAIIWLGITFYYTYRSFRQVDEVVEAAGKIVHQSEQPIELSRPLQDVQNELNLAREQALRNAMAAKEAEQKKNDLIVYLAHDLKTPLTSVIGYLTLLRDEVQVPEAFRQHYTEVALNKAERLEDLINEFFDITRFNLSTMTLDIGKIHLNRMVEQITNEFIPILMEKDLKWDLEIEKEVEIAGDANKLERVFDNLIRNAVNYSYSGTVIALSLKTLQEEKQVMIRIKNHGRTIAKEKLEHIFEQFFRVDSSRSSETGGSGLGLAIARQIVEMHHGQIRAESKEETILFEVILPME